MRAAESKTRGLDFSQLENYNEVDPAHAKVWAGRPPPGGLRCFQPFLFRRACFRLLQTQPLSHPMMATTPVLEQLPRLHDAAHSGDVQRLKDLLASGVDPDVRSGSGWTAFHEAAIAGQTECLGLLLDAGANIEAPVMEEGARGTSGLALAIMNGRVDTVDLLIRRGADLNREARSRLNSLGVARDLQNRPWHNKGPETEAIIRLLQEAGATE